MKQLEVLDWNPPCLVIAFPMAKRVGKVRRVAEVLSVKRGAAATNYWKQVVAPWADRRNVPGSIGISSTANCERFMTLFSASFACEVGTGSGQEVMPHEPRPITASTGGMVQPVRKPPALVGSIFINRDLASATRRCAARILLHNAILMPTPQSSSSISFARLRESSARLSRCRALANSKSRNSIILHPL
ncbi:DUF6074 family protein [Mesorhizobium sp. M6A.T.Ce.TU.016.01.1.1]|uniref:DUF6074 family protein n=1 Tax=Mesorhizobium sp. M6A.T.Ce.TU.016.01.1.1 TaxID=2496783 RepID=UPI00163C689C|nr:DUF6074 family protein [Mesorhizobium sp. M6A.T.Ce.TU.016.01.1.1]